METTKMPVADQPKPLTNPKSIDGQMRGHSHQAHRHTPHPSHTLMRKVVKRPDPSLKRQIKAYGSTDYQALKGFVEVAPDQKLIIKSSTNHAAHLKSVKQSSRISHFAKASFSSPQFQISTEPAVALQHPSPPPPTTKKSIVVHSPKARTSSDILEKALREATSHKEMPPKITSKRRRRLASFWTASALILLVMAIGVSQNVTNIRLQLAAAKAGFTASLPREMPSGYSLSQLAYSRGVVGTSFHSNAGSGTYAIIQRTTDWNNQTLKQNFIVPSYHTYVAMDTSGLTIFIYGNHDASWINNGVWYSVQSNGSLSDRDLIAMASSS